MIVVRTCHELQGSKSYDDEQWRKLRVAMTMRHSKGIRPDDEALLEGNHAPMKPYLEDKEILI